MSDTESIKEMLTELENDEFSSTTHLLIDEDASNVANDNAEVSEVIDEQDLLHGSMPLQTKLLLKKWLNEEATTMGQLSDPEDFSLKMQAVILREENHFLKSSLIQFHQNWLSQRQDQLSIRDQYEMGSQWTSSPMNTSTSSPSTSQDSSCNSIANRAKQIVLTNEGKDSGEADKRKQAIASTKKSPNSEGLSEVCGLSEAKELLYEAVVMPFKFPHLFQGLRKPWTTILLYGPPGTGKTHLAHAVAAEVDADFYCISTSDLLSSWLGESEKLIKELFSLRANDKKIIIFIDEIDSLCRQRTSGEAEHSRRLKTELLIQMDDASKNGIYVICATNCPWDLDLAFLRRFQRRIYIGTPDRLARLQMLKKYESILGGGPVDWTSVVDQTEGFSGADIAHLAQSAMIIPIRELKHSRFWVLTEGERFQPTVETDPDAMECSINELPGSQVESRSVTVADFLESLNTISTTVTVSDLERFKEFTHQFGLVG